MAGMFMIGWAELVIIAAIGAAFVAAIAVAVVAATHPFRHASNGDPDFRACPDCSHSISPGAATCPHCGGPLKSAR